MNHQQHIWTVEDVMRVADEERIPAGSSRYTISGCIAHPDGFSRAEIVEMLRMLVATPDDDGSPTPAPPERLP